MIAELAAEALFVSVLQPSDRPTPGMVRESVGNCLDRHGGQGCAEIVAMEFGDHPDTALERMCWALEVARRDYKR